jgi:ABC-type transporter Mla subunit MlaD
VAVLERIDEKLENANGYLDQVAAYVASVLNELQNTNSLLEKVLEELRDRE